MAFLRYYRAPAASGTIEFIVAEGARSRSVVARGMDADKQGPAPVDITVTPLQGGRKQGRMECSKGHTYEFVFKDSSITEAELADPLRPPAQELVRDGTISFSPDDRFDRDPPPPPPTIDFDFDKRGIRDF